MKEKINDLNKPDSKAYGKKENALLGYPIYHKGEDIYNNFLQEEEISPGDTSKTKEPNSDNAMRRKELDNNYSEKDLDVPGSDLDDAQEKIGSEDEENNYYSLGGDNHNDLDED